MELTSKSSCAMMMTAISSWHARMRQSSVERGDDDEEGSLTNRIGTGLGWILAGLAGFGLGWLRAWAGTAWAASTLAPQKLEVAKKGVGRRKEER